MLGQFCSMLWGSPVSDFSANDRQPIVLESDADEAALIALAGLPKLSPSRFWALIELGAPSKVWRRVARGGAPRHGRPGPDAAQHWPQWCRSVDPMVELARHRQRDTAILPFGSDQYPDALRDDPDPPPVVFRQGPQRLDDRVRVAIVGTRNCTNYGTDIARRLGASLAARGVDVVSGLAAGIDAAAHAGAISAAPARAVAVVAGGVDVVYPQRNRGLYHQIATSGALLSEWPLGSRPETWRFPARNRVVAALSAATVVVESPLKGGSMYTVDEALRRGRAVFAVPGPIHSPASHGANKLIADGAHPLHDLDELLDSVAPLTGPKPEQQELGFDSWMFEVVGWQPIELDSLVATSGRSASEVTLEVERLVGAGALRRFGGVVERIA